MVVELEQVRKVYEGPRGPVVAVDTTDFAVQRGEFVGIVGRSGSGKSTLLNMIGGLVKPTTGSVRVGGVDLWTLDDEELSATRNRLIGFVFQFGSLLPHLSVLDNVRLPHFLGNRPGDGTNRARTLLEQVGLAARIEAWPPQLSGGEQRRVAIARALMNDPELLIADEPTGDLDERTGAEVMDLLRAFHRAGTTLILVTHERVVASSASRLLIMEAGVLRAGPV